MGGGTALTEGEGKAPPSVGARPAVGIGGGTLDGAMGGGCGGAVIGMGV
jgi:hypothetical protein